MLNVMRNRNFTLLWLGGLISATGSMVLTLALPYFVYTRTGSILASGTLLIAQRVPAVVLGSLAGVFVDRWNRRHTMIVSDIARAVLLLLLLTIHSRDSLWLIYVVACAEASLTAFFDPAASSIVPQLVEPQQLTTANSLGAISQNISLVIGPLMGGALLGLLGLPGVVLVDSVSYVGSAALIALMSQQAYAPDRPVVPSAMADLTPGSTATAWVNVWHEWREGLHLVRSNRVLSLLFAVFSMVLFIDGIINALYVPFVKSVLRANALQFGWLATAQGTGAVVGSLVLGLVSTRIRSARIMVIGLEVAGVLFLVEANVPVFPLVLVLVFATAGPIVGINVGGSSLLQGAVEDRYRGRVFGALGATVSLETLCGIGVGSSLGTTIGITRAFDVAGGMYIVAGLLALLLLRGAPST